MTAVHFIYASTSGNTEYVIDTVCQKLASYAPSLNIERQRAETATSEDFMRGDMIILGSGTWNTGGTEGRLNMYMEELIEKKAEKTDLLRKPMSCISLGDDRYYFRTRCTEHFLRFIRTHNGLLALPPLIIVNEPYGQEEKIRNWTKKLMKTIRKNVSTIHRQQDE